MDELISRQTFPTHLSRLYYKGSSPEIESWRMLYLCVAHGIDGAKEVCFVYITASNIDLTSRFSLAQTTFYIPSTTRLPCKLITHIFY